MYLINTVALVKLSEPHQAFLYENTLKPGFPKLNKLEFKFKM
jgi:hypothetical protein